ncbi:MAG: AAA family ATPase [Gammaproteobacteria bacterium]|nr:AAA family ATPase [Gammaproteobacteria bacterium]
MYLEHFGLREIPFTITPDTSFFYAYGSHVEALNTLLVAVRSGEGFIKVVGEVGTGKTLLCRKFLNTLRSEFVTAYIHNPYLEPMTLLLAIADELRIKYPENINQHQLLKLLTKALIDFYAAGKRVVLCLDEVQAMPEQTLETLRLLTNLETEKRKLLQVVLFGQPELDMVLDLPSVRQLKQRIGFSYHLSPLDREGMEGYIAHRLLVAGYHGKRLFPHAVLNELFHASRGIPRLINILSHKALIAAFGQGARAIGHEHMRLAIQDTIDVHEEKKSAWIKFAYTALALATLTALGLGAYYYYYGRWPLP